MNTQQKHVWSKLCTCTGPKAGLMLRWIGRQCKWGKWGKWGKWASRASPVYPIYQIYRIYRLPVQLSTSHIHWLPLHSTEERILEEQRLNRASPPRSSASPCTAWQPWSS